MAENYLELDLHPAAIRAAERVYHAAFKPDVDGWIGYMPSVSEAAVIIDAAIREALEAREPTSGERANV